MIPTNIVAKAKAIENNNTIGTSILHQDDDSDNNVWTHREIA